MGERWINPLWIGGSAGVNSMPARSGGGMATMTALVLIVKPPAMTWILFVFSALMAVTGELNTILFASCFAKSSGICPAPPFNNHFSVVAACGPTRCVQAMWSSETVPGSNPPDPPMRACNADSQCMYALLVGYTPGFASSLSSYDAKVCESSHLAFSASHGDSGGMVFEISRRAFQRAPLPLSQS